MVIAAVPMRSASTAVMRDRVNFSLSRDAESAERSADVGVSLRSADSASRLSARLRGRTDHDCLPAVDVEEDLRDALARQVAKLQRVRLAADPDAHRVPVAEPPISG